ncbi:MAG: 3-oxoacyl-[acyl-carrier-protein] reductase [Dehalococcoidia bacterium]|nr:3-oxoacyl-[acyl-carrier-protein] reductase [Dehalococcoidia bacterium]
MTTLHGKVALVTGGSRGLGRATAIALGAAGAAVVVNYHQSQTHAESVVDAIVGHGGQAVAAAGDVSQAATATAVVETALKTFGRLDILVNNAGVTRDNLAMRLTEDDWDAVLDTNLKGAFFCAKAAIRPMLRQRSGRIINITSVVGLKGNAGQTNYAAAKAGMIGLTKALAREVGSRSITVNAVAPGFIAAGMTDQLTDEQRRAILTQIPLERFGLAEDVAAAVVFLASDAAAYITGAVIPVDGGLSM